MISFSGALKATQENPRSVSALPDCARRHRCLRHHAQLNLSSLLLQMTLDCRLPSQAVGTMAVKGGDVGSKWTSTPLKSVIFYMLRAQYFKCTTCSRRDKRAAKMSRVFLVALFLPPTALTDFPKKHFIPCNQPQLSVSHPTAVTVASGGGLS